jgi:uncharacterized damage-inducible protein DinB
MMITSDYCRLMAEYNAWMNRKTFGVCSKMPEQALYEDRGAFFKSIYLTLNHIAYADLAFMSRFTGTPSAVPPLAVDLFGGFRNLQAERQRLDDRISDWGGSVTESWLAQSLTYESKVDGRLRTVPHWALVTQLFNHQTHHRGQVTTVLTQLGQDVGSTDIPFMPRYQSASEVQLSS